MKTQSQKWRQGLLVLTALLFFGLSVQLSRAGTSTNTGSLNSTRVQSEMVLLPNHKVLIFGGYDDVRGISGMQPELYDPVSGTWTVTPTGQYLIPGYYNTLPPYAVLKNGNILVYPVLDTSEQHLLDRALLFNWTSGTWTNTGPVNIIRDAYITLTTLPDGTVLMIGGEYQTIVERYDPATDLWTTNGSTLISRIFNRTKLLSNGKLLIAGGVGYYPFIGYRYVSDCEIYDPGTGTSTPIVLNSPTKLSNGTVQLNFSNAPGANFTALASTNLSLSASNWSPLGSIPEVAPGKFRFTDSTATNQPKLFYRVRSP